MTGPSSRLRRLPALLVALAALAGACAEVGTDPDLPTSIAFDRLPSPSVVQGDTLRDTTGRAVPVRELVTVYNADGDVIANPALQFSLPDTGTQRALELTPDGAYLVASPTLVSPGGAFLFVRAGNLRPPALRIPVVQPPDTLLRVHPHVPSIAYRSADAQPVSTDSLAVRVAFDTVQGETPDRVGIDNYLVRFELLDAADRVLDSVLFDRGPTARSSRTVVWDTTASGGIAVPRLELWFDRSDAVPAAEVDTVRVRARILLRGQPSDSAELLLEVRRTAVTPTPPAARSTARPASARATARVAAPPGRLARR